MKRLPLFVAALAVVAALYISSVHVQAAEIHLPLVSGSDTANTLPVGPNEPTPTWTPMPTSMPTATPLPTATPMPTAIPQPLEVGESITCQSLQVVALHSESTSTIGGIVAPNGGRFIVVVANVSNLGYRSDSIGYFDIALEDGRGRIWEFAELDAQWAAQDREGLNGVYDNIPPSFSEMQVFVWFVAADATDLDFVLDTLCDF